MTPRVSSSSGSPPWVRTAARLAGDSLDSSRNLGVAATGSSRMSARASRLELAAPPTRGVWWGRSKASASSARVASAMTTVTLSVLPAFRAMVTSCWAHSAWSETDSRTSAMVESSKTPQRPSEQSIHRSAGRALLMEISGLGSMSKSPRTLMTTLRWGWLFASAGEMRPVLIRC